MSNSDYAQLGGRIALKAADKAFNFIPSWSELGSMFGIESGALGGVGTALGGLGAAAGAAAPMALFAAIATMINQNTDHPITFGGGWSDLQNGFSPAGHKQDDLARALYDAYAGDKSWYTNEGGDVSKTSPLDTAVGSMSWKKNIPAYTVGGAPYSMPELAVSSGRQISRQQMGLPVEEEQLGNAFAPGGGDLAALGEMFINSSLPTYDGEDNLPTDWDTMLDRRENLGTGEGQSSGDIELSAWMNALSPRQREWFDSAINTGMMHKYTGTNSPDYDAGLIDVLDNTNDTTAGNGDDSATPYSGLVIGEPDMNKSHLASALANHKARNTDDIPAVINQNEADILRGLGGSGHYDPEKNAYVFANTEAGDDIWANLFNYGNPAGNVAPAATPAPAASGGGDAAWDGGSYATSDAQWQPEYSRPDTPSTTRAPDASDVRPDEPYRAPQHGFTDADYAARAAAQGNDGTGGAPSANNGFADERPYLEDPSRWTSTPWPAPPTGNGGSGLVTAPGVHEYNFGAGQAEVRNLVDYFNKHGQMPVGSKLDTQTQESSALFDNRPGFGQNLPQAYTLLAGLPANVFDSLANFMGMDPNDPNTLEVLFNYLGHKEATGGEVIYKDGTFQGLSPVEFDGSPLETGKFTFGSPNNQITVSLNDILAGNFPNYNAIELALAGGFDPEGDYGSTNTIDAARELMATHPELARMMPGSPEFNSLSAGYQGAVPGFNQQVQNRTNELIGMGRIVPNVPIGPTSIAEVAQHLSQYQALARSGMTTPLTDGAGNILAPDGSGKIIGTIPGNLANDWMFINNPSEWQKYIGVFPNGQPGTGNPPGGGGTSPPPPPPPPGGGGNSTVPGGGGNSTVPGGGNNTPQNALDQLLAAYPGGYEMDALSDAFDDPIIQRILSEQTAQTQQILQRAAASGQLSQSGYNAAYGDLAGPSNAVARARLEELSSGLLGGYRQDIRDILADAADFASVSPNNFSIDPYKQAIDAKLAGVNNNYYGELMRALGGQLFDPALLMTAGGLAQGPINSGPSGQGMF